MQSLRNLALVAIALLVAGCSSFTRESGPAFPQGAQWGLLPLVNFSQAPQAGERAEQILLSVLAEQGLRPRLYPALPQADMTLLDDRERLTQALAWARQQGLDYVVSGSVEEWQYKSGLDGEPAVGISLQVIEPASGRVLWSNSGARAGWSRESLAGTAQKVLRELVGDLQFD
ncbi:penicillin-binding protein activator LpoB [Pseudomonas sp. LPB0260]|uniref:penicillin-binding protein activator LpoB n=1 Tax=Pseudomonas sp. LPB0260 TaxID=2614442 RepID=UPI0015C1FEA9|nr:penicillin-binding protein activator LpoB [Pseudomonas sp. LPB0260]QLC72835.1 penicillin-binding protein activator LpoB [Pseudomonas sp. LPB0260]QLC75609.1 penicillin-binding protein activator LpoB [Pseudomonas sp. LPB0260]